MGQKGIYLVAVLCVVVLSVLHGSEVSGPYLQHKLSSKPLYVPPFARRILLKITSQAPSFTEEMTYQIVNMIAPSTLAPDGLAEQGYLKSPSPTIPPVSAVGEGPLIVYHGKSPTTTAPSPASLPKGSILRPRALPPKPMSVPQPIQGQVAPLPANAPSPVTAEHKNPRLISPSIENPPPHVPFPTVPSPPRELPVMPPPTRPSMPTISEPTSSEPAVSPVSVSPPLVHGRRHDIPVAAPPKEMFNHLSPGNSPSSRGSSSTIPPTQHEAPNTPVNTSTPTRPVPKPPTREKGQVPAPAPSISVHKNHEKKRVSGPASEVSHLSPPPSSPKAPVIAPAPSHPRKVLPKKNRQWPHAPPPSYSKDPVIAPTPLHPLGVPLKKNRQKPHAPPPVVQGPLSSIQSPLSPTVKQVAPSHPPENFLKKHRGNQHSPPPLNKDSSKSNAPPPVVEGPLSSIHSPLSPTVKRVAPSHPPEKFPKKNRGNQHSPPPLNLGPVSPIQNPITPTINLGAPAPSQSAIVPSRPGPAPSPSLSSLTPFLRKPRVQAPPPVWALPPPPPNKECSIPCSGPLTNTPPGSPCGCVLPMQVGLRLGVALYTFFPLVSELAQEIAAGIFMKQSQVRIMGANAATQQTDKIIVTIDLVPLGTKFDNNTAFFTYEKFWHKQVPIKSNFFGDYDVLYVRYSGLPPSPPLGPSNITVDDEPLPNGNNARTMQRPLGVEPRKQKERLNGSLIAIIVLSSIIVLVLCVGAAWLLLLKQRSLDRLPAPTPRALLPLGKSPVGAGSMIIGSGPSSASLSFSSSIATYTGSAKTFSIGEIEKATDNFDVSRILGEGGFGRVYSGTLEDGTEVAVKVLKRDDKHGSREFLAEVEMLSRLHHRNLVKLIGICTEEHNRCLVYELIPNGSVESHLHGVDKETAPLDWAARVKIALGSARGLAYLHEDSSPCVIHRDFKSSNILLEYDFTPKVSDFGLARTALDEGNVHISTRVMGTFGYVAPEYAMTGHLLVKSDVYSYGVVLLELLTGRKPVDMSQPPGQENLVTWARPLLTSQEGLETIIDRALGPNFPFDSIAKVAAIASMCVQPEVSHRPFMGEVVQALKLVCNENDEKKEGSGSCSQEDFTAQEMETRISNAYSRLPETRAFSTANYDSGLQAERALSTSEIFSSSARFVRHDSGSFRRHSNSGPLRTINRPFWQRGWSRGSVSEHGATLKLWAGLQHRGRWF